MMQGSLWKKALEIIAASFIVIGMWYILAVYVHNKMLPTPWSAFTEFFTSFSGVLWRHFYISAYRVVISILLSLILAVPLGLLLGRNEFIDRLISPIIYIIYPIPKIVFMPVVFLLFGLGDFSKVFMISLIIFFQILVTTRDAAKGVPVQNIYSMASLGAGELQVYYHVIWPACIPKILTSLRISIGTAIAVLFFVESFATMEGLGYYIMDSWSTASYNQMFAGIIGMGFLGLILYVIIDVIEGKWCRWQHL